MIDLMEKQHMDLARDVERLIEAAVSWRAAPTGARSKALSEHVRTHLDVEETQVLPLVRRLLTVDDWARLQRESRRRLPRNPRTQLRLLGGCWKQRLLTSDG